MHSQQSLSGKDEPGMSVPYEALPVEHSLPSRWRHAGVAASLLALAGVLGVGAVQLTARGQKHGLAEFASLRQRNSSALLLDDDYVYNDPTCLRNTGGTCGFWGCNADRGPTDCVNWHPGVTHLGENGHYCMCQPGYCTAMDGKCYPNNNNVLVGSRVAIRNAQWMDYHMYIRGWDVYVDNDEPSDRGLWNVYALPGFNVQSSGQFLIMNVDYPDFALTISEDESCTVSADNDIQYCTVVYTPKISWLYKMDMTWVTTLSVAPWRTLAYTMSNLAYPATTFSTAHLSWDVVAESFGSALGPQAYWVFDPPLSGRFR